MARSPIASCLRQCRLALAAGVIVALASDPGAAAPAAAAVVGNGLVLDCSQPDALLLRCNYRLTTTAVPLEASAAVGALDLPAPAFAVRSGAPEATAVLLLVDTSDPGRAAAIRQVAAHVARLVDGGKPHQRFGLAAFDSDLRMLAPIGSDAGTIKDAARGLRATGRTTELYRNVVQALKLLDAARDRHRVLVVMSDGLAEDRAYFHADAVSEANRRGIAVFGVGYPRTVALSVGLQSLRRLAEETGGRFVDTGSRFVLPETFLDAPFAAVENVGAITVDLRPAAESLPAGVNSLRVALETSGGVVDVLFPVDLPPRTPEPPAVRVVEVEVPKVVEVEKVVEVQVPVPPAPVAAQSLSATSGVPLWYWVLAIGLLALVLAVLLLVLLLQRRLGAAAPPAQPAEAPEDEPRLASLAHLRLDDETRENASITRATFRIGRLADNDLVLADPSVSRHHAEIRRRRDGNFRILDLDSMNGVLINGDRVTEGPLADGDRVEVGDVAMTFHLRPDDTLPGEETVVLRTVVPSQPFPEAAAGGR